ncbi:MAG: hypothetical protein U1F40_05315 [Turneriella sp.]
MLRYALILLLAAFLVQSVGAIPFYWEPKTEEPGFTIDVPAKWNQASRSRDKVANVHFERRDRAGRVAIEVRAYTTDNTDIEQLVLQLRSRLAVKYDRVFLVRRKDVGFRKNMERQVWSARVGKKNYTLLTSFVVADDKVLQLVCVAPAQSKKEYEYVFDNALLSLDFSDGKPDGGAAAEKAEAPAAAAPAPVPAAPAPAAPVPALPAVPGAPAAPALPDPGKVKPPKIEF